MKPMQKRITKVVVIGAGLIGTSIALGAKQAGLQVELLDKDGRAEALANDLIDNQSPSGSIAEPELVVLATPASALSQLLNRYATLYPKSTFIDIGSTKTNVALEVTRFGELVKRFCPTHPMAGRELDGAEAAQSDLFLGKSWVITPLEGTSKVSIELATELIELLGAKAIQMDIAEHDLAVAAVSHLPQLVASLLAGQLATLNNQNARAKEYFNLAGSGILDTTRIAASNPTLWVEILKLNEDAIKPFLKSLHQDLALLIEKYDVGQVLEQGRIGRSLLPGKHRSQLREYTYIPVVLEDKPNQLAALFNECAKANVNVEDIKIEHSPEQETGLVLLALSSANAQVLQKHLQAGGWRVHPPRTEI
jgi:prephenate dehydrogenase